MKTVDVAVKHQFTYRDDGKLVSVSGPPMTSAGGWQRLLEESLVAPPEYKVLAEWPEIVADPESGIR